MIIADLLEVRIKKLNNGVHKGIVDLFEMESGETRQFTKKITDKSLINKFDDGEEILIADFVTENIYSWL